LHPDGDPAALQKIKGKKSAVFFIRRRRAIQSLGSAVFAPAKAIARLLQRTGFIRLFRLTIVIRVKFYVVSPIFGRYFERVQSMHCF